VTDRSILATPLAGGRVRYTLGGPNWAERRIPDIRRPGETVQVDEDRMIDVIILGDGFTAESQFIEALTEWLREHLALKVYDTFAGCLRIRALYTPSVEPASSTRGSFYRCLTSSDGGSLATDRLNAEGETEDYDWWLADDADGRAFREAFWAGVDTFSIATERRYPLDLDVGGSNQAIHDDILRDRYRNLIVSMLVRTTEPVDVTPENSTGLNRHPSGLAREVPRPAPNASHRVRVAFGATEVHEFSHSFGFLSDEYIKGRDSESDRVNPATASVFTLSNLTYSRPKLGTPDVYETPTVDETPWIHLSPGGWRSRMAGGPNPSPLVGWLWIGGGVHHGAWHSDYRCLMNGTHDNFKFTQVAAQDPTIQLDGTYKGENLRDNERFCLWCQELVTLRILEKTDQLLEDGDPSDVTTQGIVWYGRWVDRLRANYYELFDVARQIADSEARYASLFPGRNGEPLWQSDLYSVPTAAAVDGATSPVAPLADDELFLLTGLAALP
jgi:hypothetical protein